MYIMNYLSLILKLSLLPELRRKGKNQKGQALLIVVLVMVVALTVTLSLVSRSITNIRTSTDQANSQKALSAAEAGIERTIKTGTSIASGTFSENGTTYSTNITQVSGTSGFLVNGGNLVLKDEGANVWLTEYSATTPWQNPWAGTLRVHWGESGACSNAALEVITILGPTSSPRTIRTVLDPCSARAGNNNFTYVAPASSIVNGKNFTHYRDITISAGANEGLIMRVIPLYTPSYIAITRISGDVFPNQGTIITSTGQLNDIERKVTLFQGYPELPAELFPYSLLSL